MGDLGLMPPGTLPPLVLEYHASSSIPVILVTVSGPYGETELQNEGRYNVRNFMATVDHSESTSYYEQAVRVTLAHELPNVKTFFSSGSIIDAVLNFRALAPIDVQLSAPMSEDFSPTPVPTNVRA